MTLALIADDEPPLARHLQQQLAQLWPDLQFAPLARNGVEAAAQIAALRPDLAFLDIQMPGLSGLEVAQGIDGETRVVFVTAYDEYAVQAFEQRALDYLLKPVKAERLQRCVARLQQALAAPPLEAHWRRPAPAQQCPQQRTRGQQQAEQQRADHQHEAEDGEQDAEQGAQETGAGSGRTSRRRHRHRQGWRGGGGKGSPAAAAMMPDPCRLTSP